MMFQVRFWSSSPNDLSVEVADVPHEDIDQLGKHLIEHGFDLHYPDGKVKKIMPGAILSIEEK
jgi:hypothetical protein